MSALNDMRNIEILCELKSQLEKACKNNLWPINKNDIMENLTNLCKHRVFDSVTDHTITKDINKTPFPDEFVLWTINKNSEIKFTLNDFNQINYTPYIDDNDNFICQFTIFPIVKSVKCFELSIDVNSKESEIINED